MAKVLIVEDDERILEMVCDSLAFDRHTVETATTGSEGRERLYVCSYDLIILDWNLPDLSGLELCREYRAKQGTTPVLMLTGNRQVTHIEEGLDAGADDYLTKPFNVRELNARIRALLRRPTGPVLQPTLSCGALTLDPISFTVKIDEQQIRLVPKEFAILEFFMRHPNQVFSVDSLFDRLWTSDEGASPDVVRTHIMNLRKKLHLDDKPQYIETVRGIGYKFTY